MTSRVQLIDASKGLAIILVVVGHVIQCSSHDYFDFWDHMLFKIIYSFHMPLFIFLSGYIAYYSMQNKTYFSIIKKRLSSLMIPFFCWGLFSYFFLIIGKSIANRTLTLRPIIEHFSNLIVNPGLGLWFLWVLFFLYTSLILIKIVGRYIGLSSYIVVYIIVNIIPMTDVLYIFMIKWLMPFFIIGYLFHLYKEKINKVLPIIQVFSFISYPILMAFWEKQDYIYINKMNIASETFFIDSTHLLYRYLVAFTGIIIICTIIKLMKEGRLSNILSRIGGYCLDIYVIQQSIFVILLEHIPFKYNPLLFNFLYVPAMSIIVILLCLIISKYIIRKSFTLRRLLL